MTTYFRSGELVITERAVIVLCGPRIRFAIGDLHHVHVVRGDIDPSRVYSGHSTGVAIVLVAGLWSVLESPVAWIAALVVLLLSIGTTGACWQRYPRAWELRAVFRGMNVCLYSTTDARTFGQVRRAMVRALEANGMR